MQTLPIDPLLDEIVRRTAETGRLVLEAPPGAGKTTRVPPALLDAGVRGEILVLEPRRLAARLAAVRVAGERGEKPGDTIGYQVRFEQVAGRHTRVRYVTEGIFTRRILSDATLRGVGAVVLDEFHERHLHGDLALALVRRLQEGPRPDLKLVVMSATLETAPVAAFLDAPVIRSEGRSFPVDIEHLERPDDRPLHVQVAGAVKRLVREGLDGDVLVFLPGAAEIRRAREALSDLAESRDLLLVPLHGELPAREQDRALSPSDRPKIILSTNVAETSVTIPGVVAVVDSGLARIAGHSPWSGLPTLEVRPVSQASAVQRAGRAGRTRPGRCLRLFTRHDFDGRPAYQAPEVTRLDLAETVLALAGADLGDARDIAWLDPPPEAALSAAESLLRGLGALDARGAPTAVGRELLRFPVHPRLGRLLLESARRGVWSAGCAAAAVVSERDLVARSADLELRRAAVSGPSDLADRIERLREARAARMEAGALRRLGLDPGAAKAVDRASRQLERLRPRAQGGGGADGAGSPAGGGGADASRDVDSGAGKAAAEEEALGLSVLAAFPDRVARRRRPGGSELVLSSGGEVALSEGSVVREAELLVAVDVAERRGGRGPRVVVHLASAIEAEWLLDLFPEAVEDAVTVEWNPKAQRVDVFSRLVYGNVILAESRGSATDEPAAWRLLGEQALKAGVHAFVEPGALEELSGRLRFAAEVAPELGYFEVDDEVVRGAVFELARGRSSFAELRRASFLDALLSRLDWEARRRLDEIAPRHVALPGRKKAPVHYPAGAPPYVASRIQDFFGLKETPRIGGGRFPVVVRLLAPNQRPVQVTQDLAGFWERHYPEIRRELSRRYPRHAWPEQPA